MTMRTANAVRATGEGAWRTAPPPGNARRFDSVIRSAGPQVLGGGQ
jgi:hypothetical protein